jgi:hypothetical protein
MDAPSKEFGIYQEPLSGFLDLPDFIRVGPVLAIAKRLVPELANPLADRLNLMTEVH